MSFLHSLSKCDELDRLSDLIYFVINDVFSENAVYTAYAKSELLNEILIFEELIKLYNEILNVAECSTLKCMHFSSQCRSVI